jgi:lysozyme
MELGVLGWKLIREFEGCKLEAYLCSASVATIGWGSTFYADGTPVKLGDTITQDEADKLFKLTLVSYVKCVAKQLKTKVSQNQFDAMVSLCYNIGCGNFKKSSVLSKTNANPNDPTITNSFLLWNKASGKIVKGLTRRREAEGILFTTVDND